MLKLIHQASMGMKSRALERCIYMYSSVLLPKEVHQGMVKNSMDME